MSYRKVILKMVMSLDGFVTSTDGTHEWMFEWFGDDSGEWNRRALEAAGGSCDGPPQLRDHGPALGRVRGADRNRDEREAEGRLLPHPAEGGMGTSRDLRRGPGLGDRGPEGARRRRNDPGPRRPRLRQVADPPGPHRRIPADDGPDRDRRGPQPIRRTGRAPEAGRRRRGALRERSPRADPGAEAISHAGAGHGPRATGAELSPAHFRGGVIGVFAGSGPRRGRPATTRGRAGGTAGGNGARA